jgi:NAD/NADP transhydrogenase beta subunit
MSFDVSLSSERTAKSTANDGYAMMTIAVMTLLFLPATFFATIFAMPILGMTADSGGGMAVPQMQLYVKLAVSVTAAAIVLCLAATWVHKVVAESKDKERMERKEKLCFQGGANGGYLSLQNQTPFQPKTANHKTETVGDKGLEDSVESKNRGAGLLPL